MRKILILVMCSLLACTDTKENSHSSLEILTYSSMVGEASLGEAIERAYELQCEQEPGTDTRCDLVLIPEDGDSNLVASFKRKSKHVAGVLGLSELQEKQLRSHPKFLRSRLFAHSPYAFIANTKIFPKEKWPKNWKEVPEKLAEKVFIQDPRISSAGIGLLKAVHLHQVISANDLQKITKRIFPSWSLSYSSFQKEESSVVWSYQSSEAYHLCNESSSEEASEASLFRAIPLDDGYPSQEEWLLLSNNLNETEAKLLEKVILSEAIQTQIPTRNWMFPGEKVALPKCYEGLTPLSTLKSSIENFDSKTMQVWLDEWSL